jgi:hypothetical protein
MFIEALICNFFLVCNSPCLVLTVRQTPYLLCISVMMYALVNEEEGQINAGVAK